MFHTAFQVYLREKYLSIPYNLVFFTTDSKNKVNVHILYINYAMYGK